MEQKQQQWVDATALSLFTVFTAIMCLWAFMTGRVGLESLAPMGIYLVAGGLMWLIAGIIAFRIGDLVVGLANGFFGIILGLGVGLSMIAEAFGGAMNLKIPPVLDGWWLFAGGIVAIPVAVAAWSRLKILGLALLNLAAVLLEVGLAFSGNIGMGILPVSGWELLLSGIAYFYVSMAILLNTAYGKQVLPLK